MLLLSFIEYTYWVYFSNFKHKTWVFFKNILYNLCMKLDIHALPKNYESLKEIIIDQQKTIDQMREQYQNLQHQIHCFLRNRFGKKSEQGIPGQGSLFDGVLAFPADEQPAMPDQQTPEAVVESPKKSKKRTTRQLPKDLPRKRIEYDLSEQQKQCACGCGRVLKKIGEEVLEQLEIIPAQMFVIEHVRFKYAGCAYDSGVITADMPRQAIDKSMAGPGLLADVLVKKFDDHLPLYRQSEIFARHQIEIARSTLGDWVSACSRTLQPLVMEMKKSVLSSPKIHTDDTTVPVQAPGLKKTKTGRLWIYLGGGRDSPACAVYDYTATRSRAGPAAFLKGYQGYLQADAYSAYDALYSDHMDSGIQEVACMAHVRRKFFEVAAQSKKTGSAHQAMSFIQKLYHIESAAREMDDLGRKALRQEKSTPILKNFKQWLDEHSQRILPKSPLGNAINYALKNWPALLRYLEDGLLDIDNNAAERLMRPIAIGRKNWLFAGSDQGAENAAIMYSLIETCKLHAINPYHYLRDVLMRLPTQLNAKISELLPWNWKPVSSIDQ